MELEIERIENYNGKQMVHARGLQIAKSVENKVYAVAARKLSNGNPRFLRVPIEVDGTPLNCHKNVLNKIAREGAGDRVLGWSIRIIRAEAGEYSIACELHSIYKAPNGRLIDVTPHTDYRDATHEIFVPVDQSTLPMHLETDNEHINASRFIQCNKKKVLMDSNMNDIVKSML